MLSRKIDKLDALWRTLNEQLREALDRKEIAHDTLLSLYETVCDISLYGTPLLQELLRSIRSLDASYRKLLSYARERTPSDADFPFPPPDEGVQLTR